MELPVENVMRDVSKYESHEEDNGDQVVTHFAEGNATLAPCTYLSTTSLEENSIEQARWDLDDLAAIHAGSAIKHGQFAPCGVPKMVLSPKVRTPKFLLEVGRKPRPDTKTERAMSLPRSLVTKLERYIAADSDQEGFEHASAQEASNKIECSKDDLDATKSESVATDPPSKNFSPERGNWASNQRSTKSLKGLSGQPPDANHQQSFNPTTTSLRVHQFPFSIKQKGNSNSTEKSGVVIIAKIEALIKSMESTPPGSSQRKYSGPRQQSNATSRVDLSTASGYRLIKKEGSSHTSHDPGPRQPCNRFVSQHAHQCGLSLAGNSHDLCIPNSTLNSSHTSPLTMLEKPMIVGYCTIFKNLDSNNHNNADQAKEDNASEGMEPFNDRWMFSKTNMQKLRSVTTSAMDVSINVMNVDNTQQFIPPHLRYHKTTSASKHEPLPCQFRTNTMRSACAQDALPPHLRTKNGNANHTQEHLPPHLRTPSRLSHTETSVTTPDLPEAQLHLTEPNHNGSRPLGPKIAQPATAFSIGRTSNVVILEETAAIDTPRLPEMSIPRESTQSAAAKCVHCADAQENKVEEGSFDPIAVVKPMTIQSATLEPQNLKKITILKNLNDKVPESISNPVPQQQQQQKKSTRALKWATKDKYQEKGPGSNNRGSDLPGTPELGLVMSSTGEKPNKVEYEHQLADWDGSWAPAPIEWDSRPAFSDGQFIQRLEDWAGQVLNHRTEIVDIKASGFETGCAHTGGTAELVMPPEAPETNLDRNDEYTVEHIVQTANMSALDYSNRVLRHEKTMKKRQKDYRIAVAQQAAAYVPAPNPHSPKANIYLRPARGGDIWQIKDIYQFYIQNSVHVQDIEIFTNQEMRVRWQDACECRLPWLVAVEKTTFQGRGLEKVVGYACASDFSGPRSTFRYTVEVEIFVHHQRLRLGIGKSLMDKLCCVLDPNYMEKGGYLFTSNTKNDNAYTNGGLRVISQVLIVMPYDPNNEAELVWKKRWLEQWEFRQAGNLINIARKFGKDLNAAYFQMTTSSTITPGM
ncbi:MAG: hypothetical protein M1827_003366 [Pycnora praestabilis]|nr:MAG: hypothetical protein M1827_003366 [Pycnora praestabilis]